MDSMKVETPTLYEKYFADKGDERFHLFRILMENFKIRRVLYPGSFVHITPSFVFPEVVYVDNDKRCSRFFNSDATYDFVSEKKEYDEDASYRFHAVDFSTSIPEKEKHFDLLVSLYAGFISQHCKRYVKRGGLVLTNNSHGDAALAFLDNDYELIGVVKRRGKSFSIDTKNTHEYFQTKSGESIDKSRVEKTMRGPSYTKTAYAFLFKRV